VRAFSSIRGRLARLVEAMPPRLDDGLFRGTSEQAYAEVVKLLAEIEANPANSASQDRELTAEELAFCERAEKLAAEALAAEGLPL
jgi:hypothetical protein